MARRTAQLLAAKERLENQSERPEARQRLQERGARHRRARSEESARRHPRPHRDAERAAGCREASREARARAGRAHPPVGAPADRHGRRSDRRRARRRRRHLGPRLPLRSRPCWSRRSSEQQPKARRRQGPGDATIAVEPGLFVMRRHGAAARGGRQSRQQRREIQPARRARSTSAPAREGGEAVRARRRPGPGPLAGGHGAGSSAASSGFRPSRPAAKARPALAFRLPNASSTFTMAASSWKVPARRGGAVFAIALPLTRLKRTAE